MPVCYCELALSAVTKGRGAAILSSYLGALLILNDDTIDRFTCQPHLIWGKSVSMLWVELRFETIHFVQQVLNFKREQPLICATHVRSGILLLLSHRINILSRNQFISSNTAHFDCKQHGTLSQQLAQVVEL